MLACSLTGHRCLFRDGWLHSCRYVEFKELTWLTAPLRLSHNGRYSERSNQWFIPDNIGLVSWFPHHHIGLPQYIITFYSFFYIYNWSGFPFKWNYFQKMGSCKYIWVISHIFCCVTLCFFALRTGGWKRAQTDQNNMFSVCGSLLSQDQREDQSLCSLIYYNKRLSDGRESHPRLLQPFPSFEKSQELHICKWTGQHEMNSMWRARQESHESFWNDAEWNRKLSSPKTKKHISLGRGWLLLNIHPHFSELSHNMKY